MEHNARVEPAPDGGAARFGEEAWQKLVSFSEMLSAEGELRGLVGPRELERLWTRHILNSTAVCEFLPDSGLVADVGSGAGFPGIVLAIVRPDLRFDLIETMERRTDWLDHVKQELDLANVRVIRSRAEDMPKRYAADVVTARAVAALKKLIPWTLPLLKPGGHLAALKGQRAEQEIQDAHSQLMKFNAQRADVYDVDVWGSDEGTRVLLVEKMK
ncbi:16S rRNA (guanine(527)-N(7))-methyltransferase RsmG [Trueperella bialowiezensis]|uniref:Ribosomal RNA small subunit methyltransferase G n=1 Tax=Trueperella bialowiezensis TaxID=312285 RepID=A0A448PEH1_9ACTO|nr:16S rRNA (guanine(527)-N(7))-methyltransferase RsmG [Trueperella bialowiezensis]VEI13342.1 Ribosomal RNA small subunit methyltransferase G [Trueperella bialowiezensis]